jgi:arylsulfatase A-like enzyme
MRKLIDRRQFLQLTGTASLGSMISGCGMFSKNTHQPPNVLLISIDDLNNWIEPLGGHPQANTPNLRRFSEQSVNFTNAYCASPSCNPSRTALLTGKHPHVTGVYKNPQIWRHIIPKETTLPQFFKEAGYRAAGAGKIFHNNMPDPKSWDDYFPSKIQHMPYHYLPAKDPNSGDTFFKKMDNEIREDDPKGLTFNMPVFDRMYIAFDFEPLPFRTKQTGDYSSVKWISEQMQKKKDKPFFLACGLYRPHLPWYVPQEFFDKFPLENIQLPKVYEKDWDDLPEEAKKTARGIYHKHVTEAGLWKKAVQGYLASISFADHLFGQLMKSLEASGQAENTIVVVFSDHGWQLGEKKHWRKFALWQNVINSVCMIKVPKGTPGLPSGSKDGFSCNRNVSLVDLFPTLAKLCGLKPKEGMTGRSLIPLLKNPSISWGYPVITSLGDKHYSVIKDEWHYINYDGRQEELYNLKEDPEEWYNLADSESYSGLKLQLKELIPENRKPLVNTDPIRWQDVLNGKTKFYE